MSIRPATVEDALVLALLNRDVQQLHADARPDLFKQPDDPAPFADDFRQRMLADPDGRVFIAEAGGEAVGYVCARIVHRPENAYTHAMNMVYIDQISVKPTYQGHGCGRALIEAVFDLARAEGLNRVALDTWDFNQDAQAFFARLGFKPFNYRLDVNLADE